MTDYRVASEISNVNSKLSKLPSLIEAMNRQAVAVETQNEILADIAHMMSVHWAITTTEADTT